MSDTVPIIIEGNGSVAVGNDWTGRFDLVKGDEGLPHISNDSIHSIQDVSATETFTYLKLAKQTYTWGTR